MWRGLCVRVCLGKASGDELPLLSFIPSFLRGENGPERRVASPHFFQTLCAKKIDLDLRDKLLGHFFQGSLK